jgi:hypothetical protein
MPERRHQNENIRSRHLDLPIPTAKSQIKAGGNSFPGLFSRTVL